MSITSTSNSCSPIAARKPCGVGSIPRPSIDTTRAVELGAERAQQRRLARAGDAVDDGHGRSVAQRGQLAFAPDQRPATLGQQRPERPHAATTVLATRLIASVGQPQRLGVLHQHVGSGRLVDAERAERAVVLAHDVGADPADLAAQGLVDGRDAVEGGRKFLFGEPRARAGNDVLVHASDATGGASGAATVAAAPDLAAIHTAPIKRSENGHVRAPGELTLAAMTNAIKRRRALLRRHSRRGRPRHRGPLPRRRPQVPL